MLLTRLGPVMRSHLELGNTLQERGIRPVLTRHKELDCVVLNPQDFMEGRNSEYKISRRNF